MRPATLHDEFFASTFCPELREAELGRIDAEMELSRQRAKVRKLENIFRIDEMRHDFGTSYRLCVELSPFEIQELSSGKGNAFAEYISKKLIQECVNGLIWGER